MTSGGERSPGGRIWTTEFSEEFPIRIFITAGLFAAVWLLFSGQTDPLFLSFGALSVVIVMLVSHRMDRFSDAPRQYILGLRPLGYLPWLFFQMVKANIEIAGVILSPKLPIQPNLIRVSASQKTPLGQVIYANSITLTPGTLSIEVHDNTILVHALTENSAEGVLSGEMDRRVSRLEGPV